MDLFLFRKKRGICNLILIRCKYDLKGEMIDCHASEKIQPVQIAHIKLP